MQLQITLSGNKICLPMANSRIIQGLIYKALSENKDYSTGLHEHGYVFKQRKFKLFSFSELRGKYKVVGKEICFEDKVCLEIRSVDSYMIQMLYTYFLQNNTLYLGNNQVNIENLAIDNKMIFCDNIKVKTLSPITVYSTTNDGHTTYFSPEEEEFYDSIISNAKRKKISYCSETSDFDFSIAPTENTAYVKRVTKFKETIIIAWHGEFFLKGNIDVLNFLYNTGLGSKNSQGFGMFEII